MFCKILPIVFLAAAAAAEVARSQVIATADLQSRGYYTSLITDQGASDVYLTGQLDDRQEWRSFFVFNLASVAPGTVISSVSLALYTPPSPAGYTSQDPSEQLTIFGVENFTASQLKFRFADSLAKFQDLGSGQIFGQTTMSSSDIFSYKVIPLSTEFVAYAQANIGNEVALGAAVTSLDGDWATPEFVFGGAYNPQSPLTGSLLLLNGASVPVPEPSSALLAATAFLGMMRRRR